MGISKARRCERPRHLTRALTTFTAVFTAGILSMGSASMAMAADEPPEEEVASAAPAEATPVEEVIAPQPEQPVVDTPEPAPIQEPVVVEPADEPEPVVNTSSEARVADPAPEPAPQVAPEQPAPQPDNEPADEPRVITPRVVFATASCATNRMNTITADPIEGHGWLLTDYRNGTYRSAANQAVTTGTVRNGGVPGGLPYGEIVITIEDLDPDDNITVTPLREVWLTVDPATLECETDPDPEPEPEPEPTCIEQVDWAYTFDGVRSGTVTTTSDEGEQGDELCNPFAIRATSWPYNVPTSGSPSWPQGPAVFNDLLISTLGTFSYTAPPPNSCVQHDIYAAFVSDGGFGSLELPDRLLGSNNPYEPPFLHEALSGKGPNPTWSFTSSEGCNTPPVTPEPRVEYTGWQDEEWTCGDTEVTQTHTTTTTPFKVVLTDGHWTVVEDTDNITPVTDTKTRDLTEDEIESCTTPTPTPTVTPTPTPTAPPTTPPTTTPTPVVVTVGTVGTPPKTPKPYTPPKALATTGSDAGGIGALSAAAFTLILGGVWGRAIRRKLGENTL